MERQPISVSMLSNYIKKIFDSETLLYDIDVIGEISSYSVSTGNAFFVIKDDNALLNCVYFGINNSYIPKIGDKVIVTGTPKYYVKGGKLNFNVTNIKPFGEGDLHKRFLELKNKLEKEGMFDIAHKKQMPQKIDRIGVITSETGAVIHDIINIVTRRSSMQDIVIYPIKVQGIGADVQIAKALDFFSSYENIDAVIVGRGGGSEEDLINFNSEIVARAVYNCKKFVISAVGHETDYTICDYVADLRAPTPSAAAELLTKDRADRKSLLSLLMQNINSTMQNNLNNKNNELLVFSNKIDSTMQNFISKKDAELETLNIKLLKCNPTNILKLGYAKVESRGKNIVSSKSLQIGQNISIYFADGKVEANIIDNKED